MGPHPALASALAKLQANHALGPMLDFHPRANKSPRSLQDDSAVTRAKYQLRKVRHPQFEIAAKPDPDAEAAWVEG